ncbi:hypothetical protein [uncultured Tateyamaria sp.]|uniref:hypothetical protein n=1 Tax=uncultured Tateyamaria sp. TaxID=455651 RepID=UPI0026077D07|nr:hypothetical protein [uncultured Tateyamaria sp.]
MILTILLLVLFLWAALLPACFNSALGYVSCPTKFFYLRQATPNELGDTLAGFAGALAFIWIVVTVAMQSIELSEQRKVSIDQKNEMAEQIKI